LGIEVAVYKFSTKELKSLEILVKGSDIIYSPSVKSVVVQLPLPLQRLYSLLTKIPYEKDADVLSEGTKRKFYSGDFSRVPPVVRSCEYFLDSNDIEIDGKNVFLIGFGELLGKPLGFYLENRGANITWTENYRTGDKIATDLIVCSTGRPNLVNGQDISAGCHVIDFGSSIVDGKTVGDLSLESELKHLGIVSPSPGGMGPLVVRFLLMNHVGM
jgi:methylenetetrahydrofolate dehydrogenase (NADP+)/methenyltetrahydrofolate cyclohydrolase